MNTNISKKIAFKLSELIPNANKNVLANLKMPKSSNYYGKETPITERDILKSLESVNRCYWHKGVLKVQTNSIENRQTTASSAKINHNCKPSCQGEYILTLFFDLER